MKRFFLHFHFGNLATVFLVGMMFAFVGVPSAFAKETSGWSNFGYGIPDLSCGSGKTLFSWKIMDESTGLPAIVDRVDVQVRDSTGKWVTSSQKNVSETTPFCFDPDANAITVWVWGGANYYNCGDTSWCGSYGTAVWYKDQRYVGHIYVRPRSFPQESTHHVSPMGVNGVPAFLNYDPPFLMELRDMPSNALSEGVLTPENLYLNMLKPDGKWSQPVYSISETGTYTEGPFGFDDGPYSWSFGFRLSSSNGGVVGSSGSGYESFILDRVAPVVSTGISPAAPTSANTVTIRGIAQDVLSGLSSITVYIDGKMIKVFSAWPFGTTAKSSESVYVGPYAVGTTHSYYAVAKDRAGNVGTSVTGSFTTLPATCTPTTISRCYLPATTSGSSVGGSCSSGYSGSCNYTCTNGTWSQNSNSCTLSPTGTWTAPTCPTACGTAATNPPYSCIGGNGLCSTNSPATRSCAATTACATGTWTAPTCPTACGTVASNPAYTCVGGNGVCSTNTPATLSCAATTACICAAPLNKTVTVTCDVDKYGVAATSGSVTRSQNKGAYPACTFPVAPVTTANSTYVSDNCVYPAPVCTAPTQNVTVACDKNADGYDTVSGSVIRSQTKSAYPACTFGTPVTVANSTYVSDNCVYPSCANGALLSSYPDCNVCSNDRVYTGGSCVACGGTGCTGGVCNNGANNPVSCNTYTPTASLSASPDTIDSGKTIKLKWNSTNATRCVATGGFDTNNAYRNSAGVSVSPSITSIYSITCYSVDNTPSAPSNVTVTVLQPNVLISADPTRVTSGVPNNSTIFWSATDVADNSCTVSGPTLSRTGFSSTATTSAPVTVNAQSTYIITCLKKIDNTPITKSVIVNVLVNFNGF